MKRPIILVVWLAGYCMIGGCGTPDDGAVVIIANPTDATQSSQPSESLTPSIEEEKTNNGEEILSYSYLSDPDAERFTVTTLTCSRIGVARLYPFGGMEERLLERSCSIHEGSVLRRVGGLVRLPMLDGAQLDHVFPSDLWVVLKNPPPDPSEAEKWINPPCGRGGIFFWPGGLQSLSAWCHELTWEDESEYGTPIETLLVKDAIGGVAL